MADRSAPQRSVRARRNEPLLNVLVLLDMGLGHVQEPSHLRLASGQQTLEALRTERRGTQPCGTTLLDHGPPPTAAGLDANQDEYVPRDHDKRGTTP